MIAILAYLTYLIAINLKKTSDSQMATLMRIMTNYLQVVSTVLAFDANFPNTINDLFEPAYMIGSSSESFVSVDCFIQDSEMNAFAPNATIFKIFLNSLLPIVLILLYSVIWVILHLVFKKYIEDVKRYIVVSIIVILFLLHPALTRSGLSIFQCVEVGDSDFRVRVDINMKCYSAEHIKWCGLLGTTMILIWGIGIPVSALIIMVKLRKKLDSWDVQKYLLMLYQGLKLDRFYWELINTVRKCLLL